MSEADRRFLPTTLDEARQRGWRQLDVVLVTGDAYVDHPSFPVAMLGRVLEAEGYRVGVLARPHVDDPSSIGALGPARLFFGVTAGALDSMVANYTALKRRRSDDPYAPGGRAGGRPDRAVTVYCNMIRRAFGKTAFIVAGGIEASLRRFAHFDYWADEVRRPLLMDCGADVVVHGEGEGVIVEVARRLAAVVVGGSSPGRLRPRMLEAVQDIPGVVYRVPCSTPEPPGVCLPSSEDVSRDAATHALAFRELESHRDERVLQTCSGMRVVANPAWRVAPEQLERCFALPFTRDAHPTYGSLRIPALEQVRFSVTTHRGCAGGCAFCAINAHQGSAVRFRSEESVLAEVEEITRHPEFHGTVADLGGPTANMYGVSCTRGTPCARTSCLWPSQCRHLDADQKKYLRLLQQASRIPGVKHLFVTTGIRMDLAMLCEPLVQQLALRHTSGHLKVAPEHVVPEVLSRMRKPAGETFEAFVQLHRKLSKDAARRQYVLPYFMAAHPGCELSHMVEVALLLQRLDLRVEQCQIFTPAPGTASTVMYATGIDTSTMEPVFVERDPHGKRLQKALILYNLPENRGLVEEALRRCGSRADVKLLRPHGRGR